MTTTVVSFAVGNMDTFLAGADARKANLAKFCSSYRVLKNTNADRISIVCENVDLEKMKAVLSSPETAANRAKNTVLEPMDYYIEVEGAT